MKLLMCLECGDIYNLTRKLKRCECGKTSGRYLDEINAEYAGPAQPIGIANGSFGAAYQLQKVKDREPPPPRGECCMGVDFKAFFIPVHATSIEKIDE